MLETVANFIEAYWRVYAGLAGVATLWIAIKTFVAGGFKDQLDVLKESSGRRLEVSERLRRPFFPDRYRRTLAGGLLGTRALFGRRWSLQALGVSAVVSIIYTWIAYFGGWASTLVSGDIMGMKVMPAMSHWGWQLLLGLAILFGPPFFFFTARLATKTAYRWYWLVQDRWMAKIHLSRSNANVAISIVGVGIIWTAAEWLTGSIFSVPVGSAFAVASAFTIAAGVVLGGSVAVVVSVTIGGTIAIAIAGAVPVAVSIAFAVAFAVAFALTISSENENSQRRYAPVLQILATAVILTVYGVLSDRLVDKAEQSLMLIGFSVLLPLFNGMADFLSWYASRRLGHHLLRQTRGTKPWWHLCGTMAGHIVFDLVIAVVLLCLLAGFLAFAMQLFGLVPSFGFKVICEIQRASSDPFGEGIWLTIMLATTLIPTFLHLCMVVFAPLSRLFVDPEKRAEWAGVLERYDPAQHKDDAAIDRTLLDITRWLTFVHDICWAAAGLTIFTLFLLLAEGLSAAHAGGAADMIAFFAWEGVWLADQVFAALP